MRNNFELGSRARVQQGRPMVLQVERRGHVSAGRCCAGCLGRAGLCLQCHFQQSPRVPFP